MCAVNSIIFSSLNVIIYFRYFVFFIEFRIGENVPREGMCLEVYVADGPEACQCGISLLINGSDGKASAYDAGDLGSIPGSGRSSGDGNENPLQYSCLENPMEGGAW